MYIRCLDCHSSTWLDSISPGSERQSISCASCGRDYTLVVSEELGTTQRDQYQRALALAEEHGIDLPGAYSVLLKIMTLDEARGLRGQAVAAFAKAATAQTMAAREAETTREAESRRSAAKISFPGSHKPKERPSPPVPKPVIETPPFDPGFRQAVLEGHLTPSQAAERGSRRRMATRLAQMHNLPLKLALKVVESRLTLQAALEFRFPKRESPTAETPRKPMSNWQQSTVAVGGAVVLVAVILYGVDLWKGLSEEVQAVEKLTSVTKQRTVKEEKGSTTQTAPVVPKSPVNVSPVKTDDQGKLLSVTGPDPQTVLLNYCESSSQANRFEPVELAPTVPPFPGARLGVFRDFNQLDSLFAIKIRKDSRSRSWKAGDGKQPIIAFRAPDQPSGASRIPVGAY